MTEGLGCVKCQVTCSDTFQVYMALPRRLITQRWVDRSVLDIGGGKRRVRAAAVTSRELLDPGIDKGLGAS
jgi:hypothetical protein